MPFLPQEVFSSRLGMRFLEKLFKISWQVAGKDWVRAHGAPLQDQGVRSAKQNIRNVLQADQVRSNLFCKPRQDIQNGLAIKGGKSILVPDALVVVPVLMTKTGQLLDTKTGFE
ncbi:hypothetical protein GCM10009077_32050 [Roseibium denhamense]